MTNKSGHGVAAAVLEVAGFVAGYQFDDGLPHPTGGFEIFRAIAAEFSAPLFAGSGVHLAGVGFADDAGEVLGCNDGFIAREAIDLQFQILRHEFANDDRAAEECGGQHALAEEG